MFAGIYRVVIFGGLMVVLPSVSWAEVSQVVFTTEPQTVKSGEISSTMTIQLQDAGGNSFQAPETIDIEFVSSSASGEFLSPLSDNVVTKTIFIGNANKNFRYRDTANGTFTITIKATGRTSGQVWNANQTIAIGVDVTTSTTTTTTDNGESDSMNSSSQSSSSHYSATLISSFKLSSGVGVGVGRDRVGVVGSPLEFKVETNIEYTNRSIFVWNFGDGSEAVGKIVNHTYRYPGEYVLVLNASGSWGQVVSRANVKVLNPELDITYVSIDRVEITNHSKNEANLFGRALVMENSMFAFPRDSIIKAGQKISFGADITRLSPAGQSEVSLVVVGTEVQPQVVLAKMAMQRKREQVSQIQDHILTLQTQLTQLVQKTQATQPTKVTHNLETEEKVRSKSNEFGVSQSQTALSVEATTSKVDTSLVGNLVQTLKRFFLRTQ
jgi:hypothetical protein